MIVRRARAEDIPDIVLIGERFFHEAGWGDIVDYDYTTAIQLAAKGITDKNYAFFIAEDTEIIGLAAAVLYPFYFNANHLTGQEFLWWVDPSTRGQKAGLLLFNALVSWAKESGANSFSMGAVESMDPEKVGKFYRRKGFRPSERSFIKKFGV